MGKLYEWRWRSFRTRNTRNAASLKRMAAKLGGTVERTQVGYKLPVGKMLDEINEMARKELG